MTEKNFDKIHVNGVYRSKSEGNWVVVPEDRQKSWTEGQKEFSNVVYELATATANHPGWSNVNEAGESYSRIYESYDLVEYLGEYDWESGEIIANSNAEPASINKYLVGENVVETNIVHEFGIFRAKETVRNGERFIHFDCRGTFDNEVYGYTLREFRELMELLNTIPLEKEEDIE